MNCKQIEKRLPLYVSDDVAQSQSELIRRHLELCANCLTLLNELDDTRAWLQSSTTPNIDEDELSHMRSAVLIGISKNPEPQKESYRWIPYTRLAMSAILVSCVCIAAFLFYSNRDDTITVKKSVDKRVAATIPESNKPADTLDVRLNNQKQKTFKDLHGKSDFPIKLPVIEPGELLIFVSVQYQLAEIVPVFVEQPISDPVITTISTEKMMRIDFQTSDPSIRIIWFVAPNESSTK